MHLVDPQGQVALSPPQTPTNEPQRLVTLSTEQQADIHTEQESGRATPSSMQPVVPGYKPMQRVVASVVCEWSIICDAKIMHNAIFLIKGDPTIEEQPVSIFVME